MASVTRRVEVFTAGCPICDETVRLVQSVACPSCEVQVYDLREGCATNECREKASRYGITAVPAVAVDGAVLDCCRREAITADRLRAAGIGQS
jgi:hypothetical protein